MLRWRPGNYSMSGPKMQWMKMRRSRMGNDFTSKEDRKRLPIFRVAKKFSRLSKTTQKRFPSLKRDLSPQNSRILREQSGEEPRILAEQKQYITRLLAMPARFYSRK